VAKAAKGVILTIRVTAQEKAALTALAEARGLTLSDWARRVLLKGLQPDPRPVALRRACVQLVELLRLSLEQEGIP
jgi:hypothetical protein